MLGQSRHWMDFHRDPNRYADKYRIVFRVEKCRTYPDENAEHSTELLEVVSPEQTLRWHWSKDGAIRFVTRLFELMGHEWVKE